MNNGCIERMWLLRHQTRMPPKLWFFFFSWTCNSFNCSSFTHTPLVHPSIFFRWRIFSTRFLRFRNEKKFFSNHTLFVCLHLSIIFPSHSSTSSSFLTTQRNPPENAMFTRTFFTRKKKFHTTRNCLRNEIKSNTAQTFLPLFLFPSPVQYV